MAIRTRPRPVPLPAQLAAGRGVTETHKLTGGTGFEPMMYDAACGFESENDTLFVNSWSEVSCLRCYANSMIPKPPENRRREAVMATRAKRQ